MFDLVLLSVISRTAASSKPSTILKLLHSVVVACGPDHHDALNHFLHKVEQAWDTVQEKWPSRDSPIHGCIRETLSRLSKELQSPPCWKEEDAQYCAGCSLLKISTINNDHCHRLSSPNLPSNAGSAVLLQFEQLKDAGRANHVKKRRRSALFPSRDNCKYLERELFAQYLANCCLLGVYGLCNRSAGAAEEGKEESHTTLNAWRGLCRTRRPPCHVAPTATHLRRCRHRRTSQSRLWRAPAPLIMCVQKAIRVSSLARAGDPEEEMC